MSRSLRLLSLVAIVSAVAVGRPLLGQNADSARGARRTCGRSAWRPGSHSRGQEHHAERLRAVCLPVRRRPHHRRPRARRRSTWRPTNCGASTTSSTTASSSPSAGTCCFRSSRPSATAGRRSTRCSTATSPSTCAGEKAVRVARESDNPLQVDGVHVRRMLMMTNPVVLVRTMLDSGTRLSAPRRQGGSRSVDVTLKEGDKLTAAFAANGLPAWIRWSTRHTNVGQMNFTTSFTGWADATGNSGILLPLAYETRLSYRNVDYVKLYVDALPARHDASKSRRTGRRAQFAGAAVVSGSDDHVAAHRKGCLARRSGRHDRHRVPGSHRAVRAGRERRRPPRP